MANTLYTFVIAAILIQVPLLHEPFPDNLPNDLPSRRKNSTSDIDTDKPGDPDSPSSAVDPLKSIDDVDFKLEKLLKKLIQRKDDSQPESGSMTLDSQTDTWTPPEHHVKSTFDPSIFPNERVWVHDSVRFDQGRLTTFSSRQQLKRIPTTSMVDPQTHRFFWGEFELRRQSGYFIMPSVSPDMKIIDVVREGSSDVKYWKDGNGVFYLGPIRRRYGKETVRIRVAAPEHYFSLDDIPPFTLGPGADFSGADQLLALSKKTFGDGTDGRTWLKAMIAYFRSFSVKPLAPYDPRRPVFEAIFGQKRGVCRHRALVFTAMAQANGLEARMVFNSVHAFVEVRIPGETGFRRVDLGGAVIPESMRPRPDPATPDPQRGADPSRSTRKYAFAIEGPGFMNPDTSYTLTLTHDQSPPPLLWLRLVDHTGRNWFERPLYPSLDKRIQRVQVMLPREIPPGTYRFVLTPR